MAHLVFLTELTGGLAPEEWAETFAVLATHLPGLGGPSGFDQLTTEDLETALHYLERRARDLAKI